MTLLIQPSFKLSVESRNTVEYRKSKQDCFRLVPFGPSVLVGRNIYNPINSKHVYLLVSWVLMVCHRTKRGIGAAQKFNGRFLDRLWEGREWWERWSSSNFKKPSKKRNNRSMERSMWCGWQEHSVTKGFWASSQEIVLFSEERRWEKGVNTLGVLLKV